MGSTTATLPVRPRALQQVNFNSQYSSETATSSDDEPSHDQPSSHIDALSLVAVSLGPEQIRLNSPATPAVEKAAAIEANDGFFEATTLQDVLEDDGIDNGLQLDGQQERGRSDTKHLETPSLSYRLPSPWRSGPKLFRTDELKDSRTRKRSSSGAAMSAAWDNWQKSFMSSLPKSLTFPSSLSPRLRSDSTFMAKVRAPTTVPATFPVEQDQTPPIADHQSTFRVRSSSETNALSRPDYSPAGSLTIVDHRASLERPPLRHVGSSYLRRSASDHSLQISSTLSRVSSLGDDSRFEHVQAQVNNRAKAIKDSFQDSNLKLPSWSSLSLDSFKPDFSFYNRSGPQWRSATSLLPKPGSQAWSTQPSAIPNGANQSDRRIPSSPSKARSTHPNFTEACDAMTGDLVILGGYRGSILRSAEPPHIQLWAPVKVGLGIRKVDLEVGLNVPEDDMNMESKIIPGAMLSNIGPVDISRRLLKRLRACENAHSGRLRVHDYGYDWRLDPHHLSQRMIKYLEGLACNQPDVERSKRGATVIAHSLGGLITRHAVNQRPDLFAGVIYAGTPTTCVNILGPLRAGDDVFLSSRVLTAQVNFTIRTSYALLPLDGKCFFNKDTKEEFPVDFFDPQTWIDNALSPCVGRVLPAIGQPPPSMVENFVNSVSSSLSSLTSTSHRDSISSWSKPNGQSYNGESNKLKEPTNNLPELEPSGMGSQPSSSVATQVTLPRDAAVQYLRKVLARVKKFKQELDHNESHQKANRYPPHAVIYGKSQPTVYGAKVDDRNSIKRADAYSNLAFASGDGVVLARAAMLPDGYKLARGGLIRSERGHITLLGDVEAIGRALKSVHSSRSLGCGSAGFLLPGSPTTTTAVDQAT